MKYKQKFAPNGERRTENPVKQRAHGSSRSECAPSCTLLKVQKKACSTCIYRKDSPLDLEKLEDDVRDQYIGFKGHRICHHSDDVCCRGFWNRHKNEFPLGQIAQRLGMVEFVEVDTLKPSTYPASFIIDNEGRGFVFRVQGMERNENAG